MVIPSKRVSLPVTGTGHRTTAAPPTRRPEVQLRSPPKLLLLLTTSSSTAAAPPHHHLLPTRTSSTQPWLLPQAHKKLSHNKKNTIGRWRMLWSIYSVPWLCKWVQIGGDQGGDRSSTEKNERNERKKRRAGRGRWRRDWPYPDLFGLGLAEKLFGCGLAENGPFRSRPGRSYYFRPSPNRRDLFGPTEVHFGLQLDEKSFSA